MRKWILEAGAVDLDGLKLLDVETPEPGPGEIRMRVHAASLNYRDQWVISQPSMWRAGKDIIPVADAAGEIDAVGSGVSDWLPGDRVVTVYFRNRADGPPHADMGLGLGASDEDGVLADYIILKSDRVTRAPDSLSFASASTLPCAGLTAWTALQARNAVVPGQKVLTLGTGGVSTLAIVLARALGAEVFVTTSDNAKRKALETLGVSDVVNYVEIPEWGSVIFERSGGVDKVINSAGLGSLNQSLAALRASGEVAVMGYMNAGDVVDPILLTSRALSIRGTAVGSKRELDELIRFVDAHRVQPLIAQRFGLPDAKDAYRTMRSSRSIGKIVIDVS